MRNLLAASPILPALAALTLAGSPAAQNTGISLNNAADGYVEVPYSTQLVPQSGITAEAWITYDDTTLGASWRYPTVLRQNRNAGQESYFLRVNAGNSNSTTLRWLVTTAASSTAVTTIVDWPFTSGQLLTWTHVAGTFDGNQSKLYINGQLVGSATSTAPGPLYDQGDVLRIGKGSDVATPIEVWNGSIDEVRLWPFARTAAEIQATMNDELSSIPGLVSTWNFNNTAVDSSSTMHGTVSGAVSFVSTQSLTQRPLRSTTRGPSTPGCFGKIVTTIGSLPRQGSNAFAFVTHRLPGSAPTVSFVGTAIAVSPLSVAGVQVLIDPTSLLGSFPVAVDSLGTGRQALPIPANFAGFPVAVQFAAIDPCGPMGITASEALRIFVMQ